MPSSGTAPQPRAVDGCARKILSRPRLIRRARQLRRSGQRIVFANGCFDLLHPGHVTLLERAKRMGEALVVAVNSDRSVRRLKGPQRPILPQRVRATLLAALASVDYVTVFDEPTPYRLIAAVQPDVLVKGADWKADRIIGQRLVAKRGGRVVRIPLVGGYSTTGLLKRIALLSRNARPEEEAKRGRCCEAGPIRPRRSRTWLRSGSTRRAAVR